MSKHLHISRRRLVAGTLALSASPLLASVLTPRAAEGPFYPTPSMRFAENDNDLVKMRESVIQAGGEIVRLSGRVLDERGAPLENALVEIWQCDVNGRYLHEYDQGNTKRDPGFQGFGQCVTDARGHYEFRTIKPVAYVGRTPHIHVKVVQQGRERLVTQFYIKNHPQNYYDGLFRRIPEALRDLVLLEFDSSFEPLAKLNLFV